jgi:hypothetical protein
MRGEFLDEAEASCIGSVSVVLWIVRAEVAVCDRASQRVYERVREHIAIGVRVEAHLGGDLDAAEHKGMAGH